MARLDLGASLELDLSALDEAKLGPIVRFEREGDTWSLHRSIFREGGHLRWNQMPEGRLLVSVRTELRGEVKRWIEVGPGLQRVRLH